MTKSQFVAECEKALVAPEVALENEDIRAALAAKDEAEVIRLLNTEY